MPVVIALLALGTGYGELPDFPDLRPRATTCCASKEALGEPLRAAAPEFAACWDAHGQGLESAHVRLQFLVSTEGQAVDAFAHGAPPELSMCVVDVVWDLEWQPPHCPARVFYPVRFVADEDDE